MDAPQPGPVTVEVPVEVIVQVPVQPLARDSARPSEQVDAGLVSLEQARRAKRSARTSSPASGRLAADRQLLPDSA